jgi:hypothetical protein
VGEAKAEIARTQGTSEARQELYKVAVRADGSAVREDDAEPEALDDDTVELGNGQIVAMAVKDLPLVWRNCDAEKVTLSEEGAVATRSDENEQENETLITSGIALTAGKHYWEVELLNSDESYPYIGVTRPNLDPNDDNSFSTSTDGWFIWTSNGSIWTSNGSSWRQEDDDAAGNIDVGDRVGVLLDLDEGSLHFFKNGVRHGPGYPAGSVTGPVVCAVQLYARDSSVRLLPQDADHALLQ